jgi:hypothetical protein
VESDGLAEHGKVGVFHCPCDFSISIDKGEGDGGGAADNLFQATYPCRWEDEVEFGADWVAFHLLQELVFEVHGIAVWVGDWGAMEDDT